MGSPELWRWIWLVAAVVFAIGGAGSKRSAFLAPLAVAAGAAFVLLMLQWSPATALIVFGVVAVVGVGALVVLGSRSPKSASTTSKKDQFDTDR